MATRDEELDAMERELEAMANAKPENDPHIHRPEHLDIGPGMLCWLDGTRVCGTDCVAYNVEEVDERGNFLQGPNKCLALFYMGQQGAAALSTLLLNRKRVTEIQDKKREGMGGPPPPDPFGRKR